MRELTELELEIIAEYEQVLIGRQRSIDTYYFANKTPKANCDTVLMLIQYVSEEYLRWSPQKLYESLSLGILKEWKLANLLKYVIFPPELNVERNAGYIARLIYPDKINFNDKDICLSVYKRLLDGEIKKFPKGFFATENGVNRVCYCLKYAIDNYQNFTSIDDVYRYFGTDRCLKFLRDFRLSVYIKDKFDAPVTAVHCLLPAEQNDPFLFNVYRFWQIYNEYERQETEHRGMRAIHKHAKIGKEDIKYVQPNF